MDDAKAQLAERLKKANNILVTVSRDPSVDQLSAMLGLAIMLNKLGKHAAAVFSGQVPSTIEFLQPESTIEKNTDSLRDFIIALDKSKADKLRYKVEDQVVRIFITPYKTSITQDDLNFSQGDFNVDVVVALGVHEQADLDEAILAHGRILHDATVTTINTTSNSDLGNINWLEPGASSLSEMVAELAISINKDELDGQIATALLTGIVAETERFSNEKTTAETMKTSASLMAAGANQQLVATQLENTAVLPQAGDSYEEPAPAEPENTEAAADGSSDDGALAIAHEAPEAELPEAPVEDAEQPEEPATEDLPNKPQPVSGTVSTKGKDLKPLSAEEEQPQATGGSRFMTEPPLLGGQLTANVSEEPLEPAVDFFGQPVPEEASAIPGLMPPDKTTGGSVTKTAELPEPAQAPEPSVASEAPKPVTTPPKPTPKPATPSVPKPAGTTLSDLEASVHSPHVAQKADVDAALADVHRALNNAPPIPDPVTALNAQPLGAPLHEETPAPVASPDFTNVLQQAIPSTPGLTAAPTPPLSVEAAPTLPVPPQPVSTAFDPTAFETSPTPTIPVPPAAAPAPAAPAQAPQVVDPNAPPPVPPPLPFQFNAPPPPPQQ